MLAAAARRAGFLPLVVDSFADQDLARHAHAARCLPGAIHVGFHWRSLSRALDELVAAAPTPPVGLVLGSGFEESPGLVRRLAEKYRLLGCDGEAVGASKDPARLFAMLAEMGIRHPETQLVRPAESEGWLSKRAGGSGGIHIRDLRPSQPGHQPRHQTRRRRQPGDAAPHRYYQRREPGAPVSLMAVMSPRGSAVAFTRQWTAPAPGQPCRYGGAAGHLTLPEELESELVSIALPLGKRLGLVGLVSFDFLVGDGGPLLLDVNPRPGATLDVLDDEAGTLLAAHVEACRGGDAAALLARAWRPGHRAAAYLYADAEAITVPGIDWPEWAVDRPPAGSEIPLHRPVATVLASAENADLAQSLCRKRLETLTEMLYAHGCPCSPAEHRG